MGVKARAELGEGKAPPENNRKGCRRGREAAAVVRVPEKGKGMESETMKPKEQERQVEKVVNLYLHLRPGTRC